MASREQSLFFDEIGSLSIYNSDGSENVTQKVNSRCLKLLRPYSISFKLKILANFSCVKFKVT